MSKARRFFVACLVAIALCRQPVQSALATGEVHCHLISAPFERFSGGVTSKDFFVQLPGHVNFGPGSEVNLVLRPSVLFLSEMSAITVSANGHKLLTTNTAADRTGPADPSVVLRVPVQPEILAAGWNRISLEWSLQKDRPSNRDALQLRGWSIWKLDSYLKVSYERLPLFPELARFPQSIAEEKLLHSDSQGPSPDVSLPTVAILLPGQRRDLHLRGAAILGARLGQLGYLAGNDCRVGLLLDSEKRFPECNGVIAARWDEVSDLSAFTNLAAKMASLKQGQGLVAEFILGSSPRQRRWVLATGADDAGVEKALLTLGSARALDAIPPSPAVIEVEPILPESMEIKNSGERRITLKDIGWKEVRLQGRHSERSISGWWLPPGVALASGSFFHLHLNHSKGLTNARLEVLINGNSVGNIPLTPENASSTVVKVPLPPNLPGRDPMIVTLRASLDVGAEGARGEEEAWVTVSGDSTLETITEPIRINGLHQAHQFLVRDTFLRKAAFVVPENVSLEEIQLLFDLSMYLGKQLPSSAALWPEACGYSPDTVPPAARLQGRSVFLLGSVPQWKDGLPPGTRLAIGPPDGDADMIRIQRRTYKFSSFEPSLTLMQMLPSPWSAEETLVAGGGWKHFAAPTVKQMITEAAPSGKVYGNLCAMDAAGRTAAYDTRRPSVESFAERIQRRMPLGVGAEETARRAAEEESRIGRSGLWNEVVFYVGGALLLLLVGVRVLLAWDRERSRRRTMRGEKPLGSAP